MTSAPRYLNSAELPAPALGNYGPDNKSRQLAGCTWLSSERGPQPRPARDSHAHALCPGSRPGSRSPPWGRKQARDRPLPVLPPGSLLLSHLGGVTLNLKGQGSMQAAAPPLPSCQKVHLPLGYSQHPSALLTPYLPAPQHGTLSGCD